MFASTTACTIGLLKNGEPTYLVRSQLVQACGRANHDLSRIKLHGFSQTSLRTTSLTPIARSPAQEPRTPVRHPRRWYSQSEIATNCSRPPPPGPNCLGHDC